MTAVPSAAVRSSDRQGVAARDDARLLAAATLFTVAVLVHGADHLRRGADTINADVFWLGTAGMFLEVGVVVLIAQRHRLAPLAATAIGASLALGYVVVHFLPARGWASDSFTSGTNVSPLSWAAASFEVAAAIVLMLAGLAALRDRGGLASATQQRAEQRPLRAGITHPVSLAMIAGNAILFAASAAQVW